MTESLNVKNFKPTGSKILIKVDSPEEITKGGIVIPEVAKEDKSQGIVVNFGFGKLLPNGKYVDFEVKSGDRVLFGKYAGDDVIINGDPYKVIDEKEIIGVFEE